MRTNMKRLILVSLLFSTTLPAAGSAYAAPLYFPHIATSIPWQTEIAIINTGNQTVTGTLRGLSDEGQLVDARDITLSAHGRRQIAVADEFINHTNIGYIIFDTSSDAVHGYMKFYREGYYRAAIPAVTEVNTSYIHIPHIASSTKWWTGVSLVNTTSETKKLAIVGNNIQGREFTLNAHEHKAFDIASLFNNQPQPDIQSGWITNASGIIGLELFGSSNQMDGLFLTDSTASTLYYPHVAGDGWRTDIGVYNTSFVTCTITITPYSDQGTPLTPLTRSLAAQEKYIGTVSDIGLPAETAWFRIDSTLPITGCELFSTADGQQLAAYSGRGGTGALAGVFPKIEKSGWTGIAIVNTEDRAASITLTAYNDNGAVVATRVLTLGVHAKAVNRAEALFSQNIKDATYMAYSSDREVVAFQLNGSSDGTMLDGLPALAAGPPWSATVWQQIAGPEGGDVRVLAIDPANSQIIYAGVNGGGVFKTTDGGASWTAINTGITYAYVNSLAIDPANGRTVYAGTAGSGIFKTTDGGASWTAINTGLTNYSVNSIAIDPANSQTIYTGIGGSGGAGTGGGVFKTTDGGVSWKAMNTGLTSTRVTSLAIDPSNSQVVYAGAMDTVNVGTGGSVTSIGGGIYKTFDGGASWVAAFYTGTNGTVSSLAIAPSNSRTVYAVASFAVIKTTDGGASWIAIHNSLMTTGISSLAIDPLNSQIIYVGTTGAYGGSGDLQDIPGSIFKTTDGGASWTAVNTGLTNTSILSLAIDPANSKVVYAGTSMWIGDVVAGTCGRVFKTTDGGASWTKINTGTNGEVDFLAIDPSNSQTVYAGTWNGGVFKTINGGTSWTTINSGLTNNYVQTLAIDPANSPTVYTGTYNGGVFKTTDGGASWTAINSGLTNKIIYSLVIDPANGRTVYAGTGGGVFKTTNGGASWTAINTGLTNIYVKSLAIDPANSQVVYTGTNGGGVFKTTDGGASWTAINTGLTNIYVKSLAIDPANSRTVYAGTGSGVFKTTNGGASWTAVTTGLTNTDILSLAIDPVNSRTVYAGTYPSGVFKTTDGGASWTVISTGLPSTYISSLAIDPSNSRILYAGTNRGVFKMIQKTAYANVTDAGL